MSARPMRRCAAGASLLLWTSTAMAQVPPESGYPSRPIRMVSPFPAGGFNDFLARALGRTLQQGLGQNIIVENRAGAGSLIGTESVARSAPDGYTLLMSSDTALAIAPHIYQKIPFDPQKSFAPVGLVAIVPNVLVVHPAVPARTVRQLIALARAKPGQLTFSSAGTATPAHLAGEMFKAMSAIDIIHVPYKGSAPALADLVGGHVDMNFASVGSALTFILADRLRALGVASASRSSRLPAVPTMAEAGLPGFEASTWFGVVAPAGTPTEIVSRLNREIEQALKTPQLRDAIVGQGAEPSSTSPAQFAQFIRDTSASWGKAAQALGKKLQL